LDYAAVIYDLSCETKKQDIRSIQYHALRAAYRKPLKFSHKELLIISKTDSIDERVKKLNEKYFQNCFCIKMKWYWRRLINILIGIQIIKIQN
jgi:hypothetical protein